MSLTKETILKVVSGICPDYGTYEHRGQLSVIVPKDKLLAVAKELKENPETRFNHLVDVTAIDWLRDKDRFETVYFVNSLENNYKLKIKVPIDESDMHCPSVYSIWESANWYERETYDMYGVIFDNHPDLRRFYMPEDFNDPETGEPLYPLRKDFPLMGIPGSTPLPPYPEKYGEVK